MEYQIIGENSIFSSGTKYTYIENENEVEDEVEEEKKKLLCIYNSTRQVATQSFLVFIS